MAILLTRLTMRRLLGLSFGALVLTACQSGPTVTATAAATSIHSGQTSLVTGTATTGLGMVPAAPGAMTFAASLGAMAPPSVGTDAAGSASSTFTAPPVNQETVVTVTATYGGDSGRVAIKVNPAVAVCQFPPIGGLTTPPTPGDSVSIAPVVTQLANGAWQWVYTLTSGGAILAPGTIRTVSVAFQKPVNLAASRGIVIPPSGPSANYAITGPVLPFVVTVTGDAVPGPRADWDIIDQPPNIRHALCRTAGPM